VKLYGVRLLDGRLVWVEPAELQARPGDAVRCHVDAREEDGLVTITPELLLQGPSQSQGELLEILPRATDDACRDLPLAWLPPLGSTVSSPRASGQVIALDPVRGRTTLLTDGGEKLHCDAAELEEQS